MKVLVTGAAGFVGFNVVRALLEAQMKPIALVRTTTKLDYLKSANVPLAIGDVTDRESVDRAVQGVDAVIHCAGNTSGFKRNRQLQWDVNVSGTQNVVDAVLKYGIKRFVYTSTTSTIGATPGGKPSDENVPQKSYRKSSQYARSKTQAERIVMEAHSRGVRTVILNPGEVMGEYDYHFGWGSVVIGLNQRTLPFVPRGGGSFCHALEVGRAHVRALEQGRSGEKYILGGTDVRYSELFQKIAKKVDAPLPKGNFFVNSPTLLRWTFKAMELLSPLTRSLPPLDPHRVRVFGQELYFDSNKAIAELGFQTRTIDEMIDDCYEWYKKNGYL